MSNLTKDELEAVDPDTPLLRLQSLAQDYPLLRPALALNPSTYDDLLDWLKDLNNEQITEALEKRRELESAGTLDKEHAITALEAVLIEEIPEVQPQPEAILEPEIIDEEPPVIPATPAVASVPVYHHPKPTTSYQPEPVAAASPHASGVTTKNKNSRVWWIVLGLLMILFLLFMLIWGFSQANKKQTAASPITAAEPTPSILTTPAPVERKDGLPEGYTGPTKTIEVPGAEPGTTMKWVVPDDGASPSPTTTTEPKPTTNPLAAPANAKKLNSFTTSDGNIRCVFAADQVQCTANSTDPYYCSDQAPTTGYSDTLFASHSSAHGFVCVEPSGTQTEGVLAPNEAVTNGNFACKASANGARVVCWNVTAGDGIMIGSDAAGRFGQGSYIPPQWDKPAR